MSKPKKKVAKAPSVTERLIAAHQRAAEAAEAVTVHAGWMDDETDRAPEIAVRLGRSVEHAENIIDTNGPLPTRVREEIENMIAALDGAARDFAGLATEANAYLDACDEVEEILAEKAEAQKKKKAGAK